VRHEYTAEQLIAKLDAAGIRRAVLLSAAYWFGSPFHSNVENELAKVRAENDWNADQAARYPGRLIAFCSMNPLKDYALEELERCAKSGRFRGVKLHFGNSMIDMKNPQHVETMRQFFRAANRLKLAIVAHLWTLDRTYGREHAEIFLNRLLPEAPDVVVQIAHFAGGGPGYTDGALGVYADAIQKGDPRTKNLYFDVATVADEQSEETLKQFAARIRQIGARRTSRRIFEVVRFLGC
jgi:predicted TIM-barrel fold metal-dependent hydrolase